MKAQKGLHTVEFAVVASLLFVLLFGVLEFGRALFVWNTLTEATRRGARLAAVCPVDHASIANVAVFNTPDASGASAVVHGLDSGMVETAYLDVAGAPTAVLDDIGYVRVSVVGYTHTLLIPFLPDSATNLAAPTFSTTLPRESLGCVPDGTGTCERRCP